LQDELLFSFINAAAALALD